MMTATHNSSCKVRGLVQAEYRVSEPGVDKLISLQPISASRRASFTNLK